MSSLYDLSQKRKNLSEAVVRYSEILSLLGSAEVHKPFKFITKNLNQLLSKST